MGVLLIIIIMVSALLPLLARLLRPLLMRYMARKAEDYMRRAAGMPPRGKKRRGDPGRRQEAYSRGGDTRGSRRSYGRRQGPIIPPEYAEDVEFVEIKEYSRSETRDDGKVTWREESQVSDAEWEEIKPRRRK